MNRLSGAIDSRRIDVRLRAIGQAVCLLLISAVLIAPGKITSTAPVATLVKNINVVPRSGLVNTLSPMVTIGNTAYFIANDGASGWELWKSDGTDTGSVLVKDIYPGEGGAFDPQNTPWMLARDTELFFKANDGASGWELWKSDGTDAGTIMVKDICPGICPSTSPSVPSSPVIGGGTLFFSAANGASGIELWRSDGTAAGTTMVKDIYPGGPSSSPSDLTMVGTTLFFVADDGIVGRELWKSDGTATGTVLVKDIQLDTVLAPPEQLTDVNGTLFFAINYWGEAGSELWKSDGTPQGTLMVRHFLLGAPVCSLAELTSVGGTLYFSAYDPDLGRELWKSDGTPEGTAIVKDMRPGNLSSELFELTDINGTLFFVNQLELWKSDGTLDGTLIVKAFPPGSSWPIGALVSAKDALYFTADDQVHGWELWTSDGTPNGTTLVEDIWPGSIGAEPSTVVEAAGFLYFSANDGSHGRELWASNGSSIGTKLVQDIWTGDTGSSPEYLTDVNGRLLFTADEGAHGPELWISDGSPTGTIAVRTGIAGQDASYPEDLTNANGTLFFSGATYSTSQSALWKSDGTPSGTVPITPTVQSYPNSSAYFSNLTNVNGTLFFHLLNSVYRYRSSELWKTDGTAEGTIVLKSASAYIAIPPLPYSLVNVSGRLLFFIDDPNSQVQLWTSDGTAEGTVPIQTISPYQHGSHVETLGSVGPTLFFAVQGLDGNTARSQLWKSDGTARGTVLLKNGLVGTPSSMVTVGRKLFFAAAEQEGNYGLWQSDGTPVGTFPVKEGFRSAPSGLLDMDGTLFFSGDDGVYGPELWRSDGSLAGTSLVKDIFPGAAGAAPQSLTLYRQQDRLALFSATDGVTGCELWLTDGTETGTVLVQDIASGAASSNPSNLAFSGSHVFFSATDGDHGEELWAVPDAQINYPPIVYNTAVSTRILEPVSGSLRASDIDGGMLTYTVETNGSKGVAVINDTRHGTFTYTPNPGASGRDSFTIKVDDSQQGTTTGRVFVSINGSFTYLPIVGAAPSRP